MTRRAFYNLCLWLPIILPSLMYVVAVLDRQAWGNMLHMIVHSPGSPSLLEGFLEVIQISLYVGGLPYVAFAIYQTVKYIHKPEEDMRKAVRVLPLKFALVMLIYGFVIEEGVFAGGIFSAFSIFVGYFYVIMFYGLETLFQKTIGFKEPTHEPASPRTPR